MNGEYEPLDERTTHLPPDVLALEGAHMTARGAWIYEGDKAARDLAQRACGAVGIDYVAALAGLMETEGLDARDARRELAERLRQQADTYYATWRQQR